MSARTADGPKALGWLTLAAIFALALAARLVHVHVAGAQGLLDAQFLDSGWYVARAADIRSGVADHAPYLLSPLYPYVLVPFVDGAGHLDGDAIRIAQAIAGALTSVLAALVATRIGGRAAGGIAGIAAALFGPSIHYGALVLTPAFQGLFLTLGVALLVLEWPRARPRLSFALAGAALGIAAAFHPTTLAAIAGIAAVLAWRAWRATPPVDVRAESEGSKRHARPSVSGASLEVARTASPSSEPARRTQFARLAFFALGVALAIAPFTVRNVAHSGELVLLSANSGMNLWIGNHAGASGTFVTPNGYDAVNDPVGRTIAAAALGHEPTWTESSRWWRARAWSDVRGAPLRWIALLGWKLVLFLHAREIRQVGDGFDWFAERSWVLRAPLDARVVLLFAAFAPLAGRFLGRRGRETALPLAAVGAFALGIVLFFVAGRYRAPIMPLAIALAAVGVVDTWKLFASGVAFTSRAALASVVALVALFAGSQWLYTGPLAFSASSGIEERHLGLQLAREKRYAEAIAQYHRSLALSDSAVTRTDLAIALQASGHVDEALTELRRATALDASLAEPWFTLGTLLLTRHDLAAARTALESAVRIDPRHAQAHYNLGVVALQSSDLATAEREIRAALDVTPADAPWRKGAEDALELVTRARSEQPAAK